MSPAAASLPPTSATRAMKTPVRVSTIPLCQASARAARTVAPSEARLVRRYRATAAVSRADALEHAQSGHQVGGDPGGVRGPLLLGLAAPLQGLAQQVPEPEQQRCAEQDDQAERQGHAQQRHRADQESGEGRDPDDDRHGDGADPLRVLGGDVRQLTGQVAALGAAARVEDPSYQGDPQSVRRLLGGALTGAGAEAEAAGEPHVHHGENGEPAEESVCVTVGDGPVDDDADEDGDESLPALVAGAEHGAHGDVPPPAPDRPPQDVPPRGHPRSHPATPPVNNRRDQRPASEA